MGRRRKKIDLSLHKTTIESLSHEGKGIARIDGKATFIHGALPGEEVCFQYVEQKNQYDIGKVIDVMSPSTDRVIPICPHFESCGGCSLQHLKKEKQIDLKANTLKEQFRHIAKAEPTEWLEPIVGMSEGYRHKARLSVRYVEKKEAVLIGFRERFCGRFIVEMDSCSILHPSISRALPELKEVLASLQSSKSIAQVEVAVGDDSTHLIFRNLEPLSKEDELKLTTFAERRNFVVYLQPKGPESIYLLFPEKASKTLHYNLPEFELRLEFKPMDFTQVNPSVNKKMVQRALELLELTQQDTVLDLFCGLGNFTLPIARFAKEVIGVEGSAQMIERLIENSSSNNLENIQGHAFDLTSNFSNASWVRSYDKLLIDPPRSGAKEIVSQIELFSPKTIVYVACSPATLARDAGILIHEKGYQMSKAGILDMFPHTSHVESIAVFKK